MKIAICGGIGSGKSEVVTILRELGAKVVVADEVNAELLCEPSYIQKIANTFPGVVDNNTINKKELAKIVYSDEAARESLMRVAHPLIYQKMLSVYTDDQIVFFEIPLMSRCPIRFDEIWFVSAPIGDRVDRIIARDGVSRERAERIIELQSTEERCRLLSDEIIENTGSIDALRTVIHSLYCSILSKFS